jgi:hypothetical protein
MQHAMDQSGLTVAFVLRPQDGGQPRRERTTRLAVSRR